MNILKKIIFSKIKSILRFFGFIVIRPKDCVDISVLKDKYAHKERGFVYGLSKYLVDSLDCEASPGVIEIIIKQLLHANGGNVRGKRLLNLGGGIGQVANIYSEIGFDVYNLDVAVAKNDERNVRFDLNCFESLPYSDESFDYVVCSEIVEHIENPWKLFRDVKKVLKKDGALIVSTPNILSVYSKLLFLFTGYFYWFTPRCFSFHVNPVPYWELKIISEKEGFQQIEVFGSGDYYFRGSKRINRILSKNEALIIWYKRVL